MPSIGDILDQRYEILAVLGEGGFATVYRARHVGLLSDHAVKVLHGHLAEDTELRARFLAEGRIQARLRHPNIVAVTDIVTSPLPGLVMEFVEGETLGDFVARRRGRLPLSELTAVFLPVVDAVATAHAAGVVHRDLKPDNVIVGTRPDGGHEPRVTDFGIAKVLDESVVGGAKQRTRTGMRMGTLHYMSPEQVRGAGTVDARTDVFALGAILYELVTGRAAFASDSEFETMTNIVSGKYEAPQRLVAGLPPAIAACIAGALMPDMAHRTATCVAFREQLRAALEGAERPGVEHSELPLPAVPKWTVELPARGGGPGAEPAAQAPARGELKEWQPAPGEFQVPVGGMGAATSRRLVNAMGVAAVGVTAVVVCVGIAADVFYAKPALSVVVFVGALASVATTLAKAMERP